MTFSEAIPRAVLAFMALGLVQIIAGVLVPLPMVAAPHFLLWLALSNALTTTALSFAAARAEWRGWRLGAVIAALPLSESLIDLIEAAVFLPNTPLSWKRVFLLKLVSAILAVPVWAVLFGRQGPDSRAHYRPFRGKSLGETAWKLITAALLYVTLYFTVGAVIYPYVREFYATQRLPSFGQVAALQFFLRGPLFTLLVLALVRILGLPRGSGTLAGAAVFAILTGVAPLLIPNPVFPDVVRWAHFCEVSSENFIFALVVAWLWGPKSWPAQALPQTA